MKQLEFDFSQSHLTQSHAFEIASCLHKYIDNLQEIAHKKNYSVDEASIILPSDTALHKKVLSLVLEKKSDALKYIFVVGIGGSNLGTYAIYNALFKEYDTLLKNRYPKIIFLDTVSSSLFKIVQKIIESDIQDANEFCVNIISKSGSTTETIANFEAIYHLLKNKFSQTINSRIIVTTDENSKLWNQSIEKKLTVLPIPEKVGGRYSVFSPVGLFPLALAGIDTQKLLRGALFMRDTCLTKNINDNPALQSAATLYHHYKNNIAIQNTFFFNPELEMTGKWYRQLMGESIGKQFDNNGNEIRTGITPIVSIGSTDLHSMAQLYFGGPKDKLTHFVSSPQELEITLPKEQVFPDMVPAIHNQSFTNIMNAIEKGVQKTYEKNNLPYITIALPEISEETLGQYLQFRMMEIIFLAKMLNINAFNQPNVEEYKIETKKFLEV